ncbi:unnamed protein product [Ranitomeya imitator]|uniref:Fucolectin tachylectin-4 pentraxin-1 domain-containing protein n=1 Tax=Ranitomeya imitator TaxID=111125 RepID=A0ABN9M0S7_9NEOB|nr:unnamed protein product [Ranitomeya imitator]
MVVDDEEKANILNTFFSTVFTVENEMLGEIPRNNENPILRVTNLTQEEVRNRLNKIKIDKSPGPDGIHPRVLRELSNRRAHEEKDSTTAIVKKQLPYLFCHLQRFGPWTFFKHHWDGSPGFNIAKRGEASQESDLQHEIMGYAKNAIDGSKETSYYMGSCTHTNKVNNPWWKLDLKQAYKISYVILTNRMDCCTERLMGAEVRIGNSSDNNNPVCGKVRNVTSATISFCCNGMVGRYVSVVIPGRSESLTLCEVEVYSDIDCTPKGLNLVIKSFLFQYSKKRRSLAGVCLTTFDGGNDTTYLKGSCTHTNQVKNPWWKLDLKQIYKISNVVLTNRMDCCPERLLGAEVRIGNSPNNVNPVCGTVTNVTSATLSFCCNGMEGQYVSVVIPGRAEYLTLCEVEVYGQPICTPTGPNIAKYGEASQVSVLQHAIMGYAIKAIDGGKATSFYNGSCTHTNEEKNPWWKLDLKQTYKIWNVVLTNRMDCCERRLLGAEIRIGNSTNNNNPVCGKVINVTSDTLSFCCNGMEGRYVSVVIPDAPSP